VLFTSPLTHGKNYSTIAFETDLPRIEAADSQANPPFCDRAGHLQDQRFIRVARSPA
jgi:hypothetical protein